MNLALPINVKLQGKTDRFSVNFIANVVPHKDIRFPRLETGTVLYKYTFKNLLWLKIIALIITIPYNEKKGFISQTTFFPWDWGRECWKGYHNIQPPSYCRKAMNETKKEVQSLSIRNNTSLIHITLDMLYTFWRKMFICLKLWHAW